MPKPVQIRHFWKKLLFLLFLINGMSPRNRIELLKFKLCGRKLLFVLAYIISMLLSGAVLRSY